MIGERWLPIEGYEGLYEVSDLGRVRSVDRVVRYRGSDKFGAKLRGKVLAGAADKLGYRYLILCKNGKQRSCPISRLVAQAFVPNPNDLPSVHHKDFDPGNNVAANLEWTTHRENISHSVKSNRYAKKLTPRIVSEIRARADNGETQASIARGLGLRYETIHMVVNRRSWTHI